MFLAYLVYFYKLKVDIHNAQTSIRYNKELFRIAVAMGATIGLSHFIWMIIAFDSKYLDIVTISSCVLFIIQQVVIMTSFMCTKKMHDFCKTHFSRD